MGEQWFLSLQSIPNSLSRSQLFLLAPPLQGKQQEEVLDVEVKMSVMGEGLRHRDAEVEMTMIREGPRHVVIPYLIILSLLSGRRQQLRPGPQP
mmetsp:Transcript_1890/g.4294  ORF Transcript_1890/g.4294 Transcript_1890/m.4294 type:complete len:94 (+) Transcript_1890:532-813(+)